MSRVSRSGGSRRTHRLTPADDYERRTRRANYTGDDEQERIDDSSERRPPEYRKRSGQQQRRSQPSSRRHERWDEDYGHSDVREADRNGAGAAWADDSREMGAQRQWNNWEESDADWGGDRGRGSARRSERWGETTREWIAAQRARFTRGGPGGRGEARGAKAAPVSQRFLATRRARIVAIALVATILLCVVSPTAAALAQYNQARSGLQHIKNAQADLTYIAAHPFDTARINHARTEFMGAEHDFSQVGGAIGLIPGPLTAIPALGGAQRLLPIAAKAAQAGVLGCDALTILATKLKDPLNPSPNGLTASDIATISAKYTQIRALVADILSQVGTLRPSDLTLDSRLGPALATLKDKLPQIQQALDDGQTLLSLAPVLLGVDKPATYLVEVLDSTELRAAGGFIGNFGQLTMTGGHLNGLNIKDVDILDASFRSGPKIIPLPAGYEWFADASTRWGFRDSNLDADFPTSAQYGEQLYKLEGGAGELQGVVAVTPWMVRSALRITGPVDVPEFNETVTADNMVDQIHKYQLTNGITRKPIDPNSGTSERKAFTGYLFKHFMQKVKDQSAQDMGKFTKLLLDSLHSKDVQVYLNSKDAETILRRYHFAGAIEAPDKGDSLLVADTNIYASKINYFLQNTIRDQVTLDANGTATHKMTLNYVWPPDPDTLVQSFPYGYPRLYISYLRVYAPPNAQLLGQSAVQPQNPGWQGAVASKQNFGRAEWGGKVYVSYGTSPNVTLTWSVPHAATQSGQSWQYTSLIQRQAGYTYALDYSLTLPSCAKVVGAPPSGFTAPSAQSMALKQPLAQDVSFTVNYSC